MPYPVEREGTRRQGGSGDRHFMLAKCQQTRNIGLTETFSLPSMKPDMTSRGMQPLTDEAQHLADFILFSQRNCILRLAPELTQDKVSYPQFFLLAYLAEEEHLSMSSIARMMGHSTAAATGMVDKLQELGHLQRFTAAADRRKIMVRITEQGRALIERMRRNIVRDLSALMAQADQAPSLSRARNLMSRRSKTTTPFA